MQNGNAWIASANTAQQKTPSPTTLRRTPMMIMMLDPVRRKGRAFDHHRGTSREYPIRPVFRTSYGQVSGRNRQMRENSRLLFSMEIDVERWR
jgi:hypothetical protein